MLGNNGFPGNRGKLGNDEGPPPPPLGDGNSGGNTNGMEGAVSPGNPGKKEVGGACSRRRAEAADKDRARKRTKT